jgi:hypothetical protein
VTTFDGLLLYEWVLLVLGIVLFVVLVIGFFYQLKRKQSIVALLGFFLLPIAMIGYPSIQSIQYKDGLLGINKTVQDLQAAPADANLRSTLEKQVAKLNERPTTDAGSLTVLASADYALGHEQQAVMKLQQALKVNPNQPEARQLQEKIATQDRLEKAAAQVERDPQDHMARAELSKTLNVAQQQPVANPAALSRIARARLLVASH